MTSALLFLLSWTPVFAQGAARGNDECTVILSLTQRPTRNISPSRAVLESIDLLSQLRPHVRLKNCSVAPGAEIILHSPTADATEKANASDHTARVHPLANDKPHPADRSIVAFFTGDLQTRLSNFRANAEETSTYFDLVITADWCQTSNNIDACPPATANRHLTQAFRIVVAKDHDIATLSLISQPGRVMFSWTPCDEPPPGTQFPSSCSDTKGTWSGLISASALGAKVRLAPSVRYPWLGFSSSISTASFGVQQIFQDYATESSPANQTTAFTSIADLHVNVLDFRMPAPARIDLGLGVGVAMIKDRQAPAWRPVPTFGINIATPLIDFPGSKFGRGRAPAIDHRAVADAEEQLSEWVDDLAQKLDQGNAVFEGRRAMTDDARSKSLIHAETDCDLWRSIQARLADIDKLIAAAPSAVSPPKLAALRVRLERVATTMDADCKPPPAPADDGSAAPAVQ